MNLEHSSASGFSKSEAQAMIEMSKLTIVPGAINR